MGHVFQYVRIINHIAAIYQTASGNYMTVYNTKTGRPLTGRLSNGTNISMLILQKMKQGICLPISETILDTALGQHLTYQVACFDKRRKQSIKEFFEILTTLGEKTERRWNNC